MASVYELKFLMEYITFRLDSTNEVEQWYVRHNYFIVLFYGLICKRRPEDELYIGRNMLPM